MCCIMNKRNLLSFLQAHRACRTEAHCSWNVSQNYLTDAFRFKRAAFLQSLKSKIGLAASKAEALRINLNIQGCGIVAAPVHAPSRAPPPPSFTHYRFPLPRSLVRDGQTSPQGLGSSSLAAHVLHYPYLPMRTALE